MSPSEDAQILTAVARLKDELVTQMSVGFTSVNTSIKDLSQRHNDALLSQERRNATFAERNRVEEVAKHTHDNAGHVLNALLRIENLEKQVTGLEKQLDEMHAILASKIDAIQATMTGRDRQLLTGAANHIVTGVVIVITALVVYLVTKGGHP